VRWTTAAALLDRYEGFLLDGYGVLLDGGGALPGAGDFLRRLGDRPYLVVTNDASRSVTETAQLYQRLGLPVPPERILTSGMLLADWFREVGAEGAPTLVLGSAASRAYVAEAGGRPLAWTELDRRTPRVVVAADASGFELRPALEATASALRRLRRTGLRLVLPNPDLVYPSGGGGIGLAAGGMAQLLATMASVRGWEPRFEPLGKPTARMFHRARRQLGVDTAVFVGDQLATDVAGALGAGLDAALVLTGLTPGPPYLPAPTWVLPDLRL
jgi:HAD superfamily hydrolase (TIGR01450 family)